MKTTIIFIKSTLIALLLLVSSVTFASDRYYICAGSTLTLNPDPITGVTYSWDVKDLDGTTSLTNFPGATAPTTLPSAPGIYKVILISTATSAAECPPDPVTYEFVVLPPLTVTLGTPTNNGTYCTSATSASSEITPASSSVLAAYTSDLISELTYTVTKNGATVDPLTYGAVDATTKKYTLTTTEIGEYKIVATVKYKQKTGFTNTLLNTAGCPVSSSEQIVTVTAKPGRPAISIVAN